ncbi:glycerol dehydratase reactivase beta/small subunit family protein [Levilactobacillus namurensis]|uniref:glycerol dehydratase reactivase beta/small subunit family protein n=1 Tax=Levilactobacillus namurensis TaxID=380393 RepID=UPI001E0B3B9B|nr:glycerol dehydratase reactivase beta/small subunit family protein [Levilactobacillus namurensis]MCW3777545.1 glycerol dehydratase reactivase beta/small subunit family protein [Levilactobacillus namurensis]MDT7018745.1 glycerol dehydratase reactivase beta/small subunit family protein [Levilactobacillus namurensis]WNN66634.1 glycerol dehydratase reactivase beta/small subunit family protein [Levilactobacillus namurensis]HJE44801.1 glycerol dehydratase reactivase beta/small subunit family protei
MSVDTDRPAILIAVTSDTTVPTDLKALLDGIEEEEIPVNMAQISVPTAVERAYQAALASRLSVGIGFDDQQIIVHYKNLPSDQPLFSVSRTDTAQFRALGANAARLVKGVPFKKLKD